MYRQGVGCVIIDPKTNLLLVGQRPDSLQWQFPQGGIDPDDQSIESAVRREVAEEVGVYDLKIIKKLAFTTKYEFPDQQCKYGQYEGQEQSWFLVEPLDKPDLSKAKDREFIQLRWVTADEAIDLVVYFKKPVYRTALKEFGLIQ